MLSFLSQIIMSDVELTAVRDAHRFDETKLNAFLEEQILDYEGPVSYTHLTLPTSDLV